MQLGYARFLACPSNSCSLFDVIYFVQFETTKKNYNMTTYSFLTILN
jgi:hypothetical protein